MYQQMETSSATIDQLRSIWSKKQYRILPTPILRHIRQDRQISSDAFCLWFFLYELAYFDEDWEISISRQKMSIEFHKGVRTISRLIKILAECGYLVVCGNGGSTPTYAVRFPRFAIEQILQHSEDRKIVKNTLKERRGGIDRSVNTHGQNCQDPHDKSVHHTNNININKYNNNNMLKPDQESTLEGDSILPVVVDDIKNATGSELESAKAKVDELNQKIKVESLSLPGMRSQQKRVVLKHIKSLDDKRFNLSSRIAALESKRMQQTEKSVSEKYWCNHAKQMYLHSGERKLTELQYHRLRKQLSEFGYDPGKLNQVTNELIFEIRFGSLRQSNINKEQISIEHSINIGIKLLRENRWQKPKGMDKCKQKNTRSG